MYELSTSMLPWSYSYARTLSGGKTQMSSRTTQRFENIDIFKQIQHIPISASPELSMFAPPIKNLFWYHKLAVVL